MDPSTLTFGLSLGPRPLTPEPETLHAGPELSIGSNRDADKKKGGARGDWCCFKVCFAFWLCSYTANLKQKDTAGS